MRTLFVGSPYGSHGVGHALPGTAPVLGIRVRPALGQVSGPDIVGLNSLIDDILKELPADVLGTYEARKRQCQRMIEGGGLVGLGLGGKCLYDLYEELKDVVRGARKQEAPAQKPPPPAAPPAAGFPVVPVAIGVAALAAIVLVVAR